MVDGSDPAAQHHLDTVEQTLSEIGATQQPRLLIINKIDRLESGADELLWLSRFPDAVLVSAAKGEGLDLLTERVREEVIGPVQDMFLSLPISAGKSIDFLEKRAEVRDREYGDDRVTFDVCIGRRQLEQLRSIGEDLRVEDCP